MSDKNFDRSDDGHDDGHVVELFIDDDELEAALEQELLELSSSCQPLGPNVAKCAKSGCSVGDQSERAERFTLSGRRNRLSNQLA